MFTFTNVHIYRLVRMSTNKHAFVYVAITCTMDPELGNHASREINFSHVSRIKKGSV